MTLEGPGGVRHPRRQPVSDQRKAGMTALGPQQDGDIFMGVRDGETITRHAAGYKCLPYQHLPSPPSPVCVGHRRKSLPHPPNALRGVISQRLVRRASAPTAKKPAPAATRAGLQQLATPA